MIGELIRTIGSLKQFFKMQQRVKEAVDVLFGNAVNSSARNQAHKWLNDWKEENNPEGWAICFELLANASLAPHARFFSLICLQHKIMETPHWKTLPKGMSHSIHHNSITSLQCRRRYMLHILYNQRHNIPPLFETKFYY